MNRTSFSIAALVALAAVGALNTACSQDPGEVELAVDRGTLTVCASVTGGDQLDLDVSGTVVALDEPLDGCARTVSIEDADGGVTTFGLDARDPAGGDLTPELDLEVGQMVDVRYRYKVVWGDVAGLTIHDAEGLVLAADEGAWGGALDAADLPGLAVGRTDEVLAVEATDCQPIEGFEIAFTGDDAMTLTPVGTGPVRVNGVYLEAWALAAWDLGDSNRCEVSDATGMTTWMVVRAPN